MPTSAFIKNPQTSHSWKSMAWGWAWCWPRSFRIVSAVSLQKEPSLSLNQNDNLHMRLIPEFSGTNQTTRWCRRASKTQHRQDSWAADCKHVHLQHFLEKETKSSRMQLWQRTESRKNEPPNFIFRFTCVFFRVSVCLASLPQKHPPPPTKVQPLPKGFYAPQ